MSINILGYKVTVVRTASMALTSEYEELEAAIQRLEEAKLKAEMLRCLHAQH